MGHVIGRVEVLAIPAGGESHVDHDTSLAWLLGEVEGFARPGVHVLQTCVCELAEFLGFRFSSVGWIACCCG